MEQGCGGEGQWRPPWTSTTEPEAWRTSGRLVGGRIAPWGVALFCTSVGSRRSDCRRRAVISRAQETQAVPGRIDGGCPASKPIGVPVDACIAS